jgi:hypothetical protein
LVPKRRCGNPPSLCARLVTASGSRVRLSAFEENRSQPLCTGLHPERMRPHLWLLLRELLSCSERILEAPGSGKTPRAISAKSTVLSPAARIVSPTPANTRLVRRSRGLWCGQRKRGLGSPWAAARSVRLHRTPRIEIDQSDFSMVRTIFFTGIRQLGARGLPRGTAQPSRSRYTRARLEPAGGSGKSGGKSLPAADPSIGVARLSAARLERWPSRPSASGSA